MNELFPLDSLEQIPPSWRGSPIGLLVEYQNLERPLDSFTAAQMVVGMCMDHRKHLRMPEQFAYIIRTGGANMRYSEFKVSYAIAVGQLRYMALIGHDNCGMVNLASRREAFVDGLVQHGGWDREAAEQHFHCFAPLFEIEDSGRFLLSEARRLRLRYPKLTVVPMMYQVATNRLWGMRED